MTCTEIQAALDAADAQVTILQSAVEVAETAVEVASTAVAVATTEYWTELGILSTAQMAKDMNDSYIVTLNMLFDSQSC